MKRLLLLLPLLACSAFGQTHSALPVLHNTFRVEARHCQKYHVVRHKFIFWGRKVDAKRQEACLRNEQPYTVRTGHNLLTNGEIAWEGSVLANTSTQAAACNYIALSNDATAIAATDCATGSTTCTLAGELAVNGFSRAQATYTAPSGTTRSFSLTKTFTATGAQSIQKVGIFNAASSGTECYEDTFSQVAAALNDTVSYTHNVSF